MYMSILRFLPIPEQPTRSLIQATGNTYYTCMRIHCPPRPFSTHADLLALVSRHLRMEVLNGIAGVASHRVVQVWRHPLRPLPSRW